MRTSHYRRAAPTLVLLGWTLSIAILVPQVANADGGATHHIPVHLTGSQLPEKLSLTGPSVDPASSLLKCRASERRIVVPLIDEMKTIVQRQDDKRIWSQFADHSTILDPRTNVQLRLIRTESRGSYVIRVDTIHTSVPLPTLLPAMYDCLTLRYGTGDQVTKLGLYDPNINVSVPIYSPALGFYIVL